MHIYIQYILHKLLHYLFFCVCVCISALLSLRVGYTAYVNANQQQTKLNFNEPGNRASCFFITVCRLAYDSVQLFGNESVEWKAIAFEGVRKDLRHKRQSLHIDRQTKNVFLTASATHNAMQPQNSP